MPRKGFLNAIRRLCDEYGIVFYDKEAIWDCRDWTISDHDTCEEA